ncbi:MAG: hypothetical protein Q4E47_00930 [Candidatus Saccharibacteria bacterium]|nr:hypothetical protein [Candidatus Saccharibacteria bacterium]
MNSTVIFLAIAIVIVGIMVFIAITLTGHKPHEFDKEIYQSDFLSIENQLIKEQPLTFNASVIEADKLLDKALRELDLPGKTMGERMKSAHGHFSEENSVWYVHKIRNQIAHERGFQVDYNQAKRALATYRQALKDLGAI